VRKGVEYEDDDEDEGRIGRRIFETVCSRTAERMREAIAPAIVCYIPAI
jgi:hypothetical protein